MMFGGVAIIFFILLIVEVTAYWHARNIFEEAAAEGVRIAAAYDGDCPQAVAAAEAIVVRRAGNWADGVDVDCSTVGGTVTVVVFGATPGVLSGAVGYTARVSESTPKER
jgi:hypothetical protein